MQGSGEYLVNGIKKTFNDACNLMCSTCYDSFLLFLLLPCAKHSPKIYEVGLNYKKVNTLSSYLFS